MTRLRWIVIILALGAWFGLKDFAYRSFFAGQTLTDQTAATYNNDDGWAVLPVETPPGAWTEPWGIDLFIVPPPTGVSAGNGLVGDFHPRALKEMTRHVHQIERVFAPAGPSYGVMYRHPSASLSTQTANWDVARDDLIMAFERYLYTKNNMRGILLVSAPGTEELVSPILTRIESDPRLLERFSGVVWLQDGETVPDIKVNCSPVMEGNCSVVGLVRKGSAWTRWILPTFPRTSVHFEFEAGDELATELTKRNTQLSIWLDENAPKPAEPLGGLEDMEVVEIAPIRRPGETDEALAEAELRRKID